MYKSLGAGELSKVPPVLGQGLEKIRSHGLCNEGANIISLSMSVILQCMSPTYLPLHCSNGECGHILTGHSDQCPKNCSINEQCASCLSTPSSGWCAYGGLNGLGVCMEGGLTGPRQGMCSAVNVTYGPAIVPDALRGQ